MNRVVIQFVGVDSGAMLDKSSNYRESKDCLRSRGNLVIVRVSAARTEKHSAYSVFIQRSLRLGVWLLVLGAWDLCSGDCLTLGMRLVQ
ncbi:hypothetical protein AMJ87_07670 [candidate division WOR_3 bacterium SM23_60]|uniref:Uncharacterized protein n=1 Tax=candidate division WOR_3 bacterium SM23_60 TaxID=1703780 RepID=A0A0S8GDP0_UNCW3|nr:MAG: hypothetical protein AMJ87_07670 [candidate division WOR_3 bacterium SM23_60]